jgi:hypothetical protein
MKWISVSVRLPEEGEDVLCYWGDHLSYDVGTYSGQRDNGWHIWQDSNGAMNEFDADPTHWMPLPEPPK